MPRVKRSVHARKKRRKVLDQAKGYWGLKKSSYRYAKEQVEHSLAYAYRDRKAKKRFKVTGAGKLLRRRANRTTPPGHLVKSKSGKRRRVRQARPVAPSDLSVSA